MPKTKLIKKRIEKPLKWLAIAILGLFISTFLVLQLPSVQNRLFRTLMRYLSSTTQFTLKHQHFKLKWLCHASLTGLTIQDPQDKTMLAVDQLTLKINPLQLLVDQYITLKAVRIQDAQVHLHKENKEEGYNIHIFLQRLVGAEKLAPATQHTARFVVDSASLHNITFSLDDHKAVPLQDAWDTQHLAIHKIDAELANLKIQTSTLAVDIRHFTGRHAHRPLFVDHLSASLTVAPGNIQCKTLQLRTRYSTLEGGCTLTYDPSLPLAACEDNMRITAALNNAVISTEELAVFVPYFGQNKASYTFSGAVEGKVNDFRIKGFRFDFGDQGSHVEGHVSVQGLPRVQEAIFDMELKQGVLHTQDLLPYLDKKRHKLIEKFNLMQTQGRFHGRLADFIAKATLDTDLGEITTDLSVRINPTTQCTTYKGAIATRNFELGTWLNNPTVQQLTMQGQIDGEGLSWKGAHCQLEANIDKLGFRNYTYEKVYAHGHFSRAFFQGKLTVDDPHLKLRADASINLNGDTKNIAVHGVLDKACLQALQLTNRPATLCTQLSIAMRGLSLDNLKADAQLHQFCFNLEDEVLRLDALSIHADQGDFGRLLEVDSALLTLKAEGDFTYTSLVSDLRQFIQGYRRRLEHVALPPQKYVPPYTLAYQLHCKDINPLLHVFGIDAYVSPNTLLEGSFSQQEETSLSLRLAETAALSFKQNRWESTHLELSARQSKDGQAVSAMLQLASKEQQWGRLAATEDLALTISWQDDQIAFSGSLGQQEALQPINLRGQAVLLDRAIEITLTPPNEVLAENSWYAHPENRVMISNSRTQFQNFSFHKGPQQISLVGILSTDPTEVLHINIDNYALANINPFVNKQLTGVLNAAAVLQGTLGQPHLDSDITLQKLTIDDFLVGDIHAQTAWNNASQRLNLTCQVNHLQQQTVAIKGFYEPSKAVNSLQLTTHFTHAPLAAVAPFVANHLSQLVGELYGTVHIHGSPAKPSITGGASIKDAAVKINYLNTYYQVDGALTFDDQAINISTLHLSDNQQGKVVLQGKIIHKGFEDFRIDATGSVTNFTLLSTAPEDNEYFYGTGVLSGSLTASGPLSNMVVCLNATTDPGTHIFIPIRRTSNVVTQHNFIRFLNFKTPYQAAQPGQVACKGFKLTLVLGITPDAHTEVILDTKTGDAIKGRGNGNLKLEVDLESKLTMAGNFKFVTGAYTFSLSQVVNRTFKILPESQITWYDSPTQGMLDVKAVYEQRASLASLLEDSDTTVGRGSGKYPVQVLVGLQGALLSPKKSFSVDFPEYPGEFDRIVQEFKRKAKQDSKYAETQALSLLLFRAFSGKHITDAGSNTVGKRLSTLASQQLSNLASSLNNSLEVDLDMDLAALERKDSDMLYLNLAYKLTDRLRVTRKGSLSGAEHTSSTARLIGDWTVEYVLTQDGRLRAKLYNKYITHATHMDTEGTTILSGGVGLLYTRGFNQWKELWRRHKRAATQKAKKYRGGRSSR